MNQHTINSRKLSSFSPNEPNLVKNTKVNYLFDLSYLGILEVQGEKASEFLQGQLTCDLKSVSETQMAQGLQCNLKGRILASLDVFNWQGYKLLLPQDILEATQNSLHKTALLSRVSFKKNENLKVFGFYLQDENNLPPGNFSSNHLYELQQSEFYCVYYLGNGFYIYIVKAEYEQNFIEHFKNSERYLGSLAWHQLKLELGQIEIYPETRGLFLPHRLDFQKTAFISFNKGCYKGQEIIARTHYKATLKHQLQLFELETLNPLHSGLKLLNKEGIEQAELIDYSPLNDNRYLVALSILKNSPSSLILEGQQEEILLKNYS